ncbi:pseudouridine synthase [Coprinopsis sp. MPI-PUGE-AT-0042]|nr:pseudouridine synthase [Coprinopsis sp. MPI-PUGE-AT-0042]
MASTTRLQQYLTSNKLPRSLKSVLYLDRQILVMNKPPGLVCQLGFQGKDVPARNRLDKTLEKIEKDLELPSPLSPLHRLDAGTTGCLAVAMTKASARSISQQFAQGKVGKTYLALVRGGKQTFPGQKGTIDHPIEYEDGYFRALHAAGSKAGKPSVTEWEVVASSPFAPLSLVRLDLVTGNKHQLRIHLANVLGAPILGDTLYSKTPVAHDIERKRVVDPSRLFLHATEQSITRFRRSGPHKQCSLKVVAPLPKDFIEVCDAFKLNYSPESRDGGVFLDGERQLAVPEFDGQWLTRSQQSVDHTDT